MGHLKDINKGYFSHMFGALSLAFWYVIGAFLLVMHALIPDIFVDAGKNTAARYDTHSAKIKEQ